MVFMMIAACAGAGSPTGDLKISVAVWAPQDLSTIAHGQEGIGDFLAGRIVQRITEMQAYQTVERQELLKAMEELNIGSSELADTQAQLRLGRIIGARQMVFGAFQVAGSSLRLDLRRVDVASGKILKTATALAKADDIDGWLSAADHAALDVMTP
jgi:hypothetical protein